MRRLGLATIPLSCLFIRASVQTYHMFLATHLPTTMPSPSTSLTESDPTTSPTTTAALAHIDLLFRRALGRAGALPSTSSPIILLQTSSITIRLPSIDALTNYATTITFFLLIFLVLLALKILLGMLLLYFARRRYQGMKEREISSSLTEGKRLGLWGVTELGDERRKVIYEDDPEKLRKLRERDQEVKEKVERERQSGQSMKSLQGVERYSMVAKRIW